MKPLPVILPEQSRSLPVIFLESILLQTAQHTRRGVVRCAAGVRCASAAPLPLQRANFLIAMLGREHDTLLNHVLLPPAAVSAGFSTRTVTMLVTPHLAPGAGYG